MKQITNKASRRLGIPGRPALVLDPGQSVAITDEQLKEHGKSRIVSRWFERGVLEVTEGGEKAEIPKPPQGKTGIVSERIKPQRVTPNVAELPEGVSEEGVFKHHVGGGWWDVYVNGFKVTTDKVRKAEAKAMMAEYEDGTAD